MRIARNSADFVEIEDRVANARRVAATQTVVFTVLGNGWRLPTSRKVDRRIGAASKPRNRNGIWFFAFIELRGPRDTTPFIRIFCPD